MALTIEQQQQLAEDSKFRNDAFQIVANYTQSISNLPITSDNTDAYFVKAFSFSHTVARLDSKGRSDYKTNIGTLMAGTEVIKDNAVVDGNNITVDIIYINMAAPDVMAQFAGVTWADQQPIQNKWILDPDLFLVQWDVKLIQHKVSAVVANGSDLDFTVTAEYGGGTQTVPYSEFIGDQFGATDAASLATVLQDKYGIG